MAGRDGGKRFLSGNRRGHGGDEGAGGSKMRFLGHVDVAAAASLGRAMLRSTPAVRFHPANRLILFASFRQMPKVDESTWRCVPFFRGTDAANSPPNTDLHPLQSLDRDAVHQMRHPDAADAGRAPRPDLRSADLQLRGMR